MIVSMSIIGYANDAKEKPPSSPYKATDGGRVIWSGVQESNPHSRLRRPLYYPLYERRNLFI